MTRSSLPFVGRLTWLWNRLRSNYWFVPALIIAAFIGLSYVMLAIDVSLPGSYVKHLGWVYTRDPQGARDMLSVISESMMTVAGVVFSVTIVALTLASNQFGTRVLKSFARDTGNQLAFGTLLGTFLYALLVMRRVQGGNNPFVPSISVAVGFLLAALSAAVLVYFIHHVIEEIQAENVVAAVSRDVYSTMDVLYPEEIGHGGPPPAPTLAAHESALIETAGHPLRATREGFLRTVDEDKIMALACRGDAVVRLFVSPGDFILRGMLLARCYAARHPGGDLELQLRNCLEVGPQRSYDDDISFGLEQLSLIAVRSLSPALNALGSANDALDRLLAAIARLGVRKIPSRYRRDDHGRLRIVTEPWDASALLDRVLGPIAHAAADNPSVVLHAMSALQEALQQVRNPDLGDALAVFLDRFADDGAASNVAHQRDRRRILQFRDHLRSHRPA